MKTPTYEPSVGSLNTWLMTRPQNEYKADVYRFVLSGPAGGSGKNNGNPLLYTTGDFDLTVPYLSGSTTFLAAQAIFDHEKMKAFGSQKKGLDTSTWQVMAAPYSSRTTVGGTPWLAAIGSGLLEDAICYVDRVFATSAAAAKAGVLQGAVNIFTGYVGEVNVARSYVVLTLTNPLGYLNRPFPRNTYSATCRWALYQPGCYLIAANFGVNGKVLAAPQANSPILQISVPTPGGSGTFAFGKLTMTSGLSKGYSRTIRNWTPGGTPATFLLIKPFLTAINVGDKFIAYPGCDHTYGSCTAFGNTIHFGGEPNVPSADMAY